MTMKIAIRRRAARLAQVADALTSVSSSAEGPNSASRSDADAVEDGNGFLSPDQEARRERQQQIKRHREMQQEQRQAPNASASSSITLHEDDSCIRLSLDVPGLRSNDLEVTVQRGILYIRGFIAVRTIEDQVLKKQRFARRFAVDTDVVDVTRATATVSSGVLLIHAPKKSKPVLITIPVTDSDEEQDEPAEDSTATTISDEA